MMLDLHYCGGVESGVVWVSSDWLSQKSLV